MPPTQAPTPDYFDHLRDLEMARRSLLLQYHLNLDLIAKEIDAAYPTSPRGSYQITDTGDILEALVPEEDLEEPPVQ